jgi:hypothetical protein
MGLPCLAAIEANPENSANGNIDGINIRQQAICSSRSDAITP